MRALSFRPFCPCDGRQVSLGDLSARSRYMTLRLGTADADTILKRFTRDNLQHPTYQALVELGKAIKTTFLCHYLHAEASRRAVNEGLNVVENWNSANDFIFYGKSGEIATNQLDDQEI